MSEYLISEFQDIAHHRNGVTGAPFHVVLFVHDGRNMVAVVGDEPGAVAVMDRDKLARDCIAFGENSYRGDMFEPELRAAIFRWEHAGDIVYRL